MRKNKFDHDGLAELTGKEFLKYLDTLSLEDLKEFEIESALLIAYIDDVQSTYAYRWGYKEWWEIPDESPSDMKQQMQEEQDRKNKYLGNYRYIHTRISKLEHEMEKINNVKS